MFVFALLLRGPHRFSIVVLADLILFLLLLGTVLAFLTSFQYCPCLHPMVSFSCHIHLLAQWSLRSVNTIMPCSLFFPQVFLLFSCSWSCITLAVFLSIPYSWHDTIKPMSLEGKACDYIPGKNILTYPCLCNTGWTYLWVEWLAALAIKGYRYCSTCPLVELLAAPAMEGVHVSLPHGGKWEHPYP